MLAGSDLVIEPFLNVLPDPAVLGDWAVTKGAGMFSGSRTLDLTGLIALADATDATFGSYPTVYVPGQVPEGSTMPIEWLGLPWLESPRT